MNPHQIQTARAHIQAGASCAEATLAALWHEETGITRAPRKKNKPRAVHKASLVRWTRDTANPIHGKIHFTPRRILALEMAAREQGATVKQLMAEGFVITSAGDALRSFERQRVVRVSAKLDGRSNHPNSRSKEHVYHTTPLGMAILAEIALVRAGEVQA